MSLLQQNILCTASQIDNQDGSQHDHLLSQPLEDHQWLVDFLTNVAVDDLSDDDATVSYYVSGYIGRAISRRRHCSSCTGLLVLSSDAPPVNESIPERYKTIIQMTNRGGLSEPTELCFGVTTLAVQYYTAISGNSNIMKKLLCCQNQQAVFVEAVCDVVQAFLCGGPLFVRCESSHDNFVPIIQTAFNCFAKNELKRINCKATPAELPAKNLRKIRKLTSKVSEKLA